jgi:hypothetical protein
LLFEGDFLDLKFLDLSFELSHFKVKLYAKGIIAL